MYIQILFVLMTLSGLQNAWAQSGGNVSGGGDVACGNKINHIVSEISKWLENESPKNGLKLPPQLSVDDYISRMRKSINTTKFECVGEGDNGHPVEYMRVPKVCNYGVKAPNLVVCDFNKFNSLDDSTSYKQIHHELAIGAEIEKPIGDDGRTDDFSVSEEIDPFLKTEPVTRLAMNPKDPYSVDLVINNIIYDGRPELLHARYLSINGRPQKNTTMELSEKFSDKHDKDHGLEIAQWIKIWISNTDRIPSDAGFLKMIYFSKRNYFNFVVAAEYAALNPTCSVRITFSTKDNIATVVALECPLVK